MSNASPWRTHSVRLIDTEIRAGLAAGQTKAEIRKRVDAAYPFGMRQYHPYKIWLSVRREAFATHGLRTEAEQKRDQRDAPKVMRASRRTTAVDIEGARRDGLIT